MPFELVVTQHPDVGRNKTRHLATTNNALLLGSFRAERTKRISRASESLVQDSYKQTKAQQHL